jgi:hypothetical protein
MRTGKIMNAVEITAAAAVLFLLAALLGYAIAQLTH